MVGGGCLRKPYQQRPKPPKPQKTIRISESDGRGCPRGPYQQQLKPRSAAQNNQKPPKPSKTTRI
jgi:hypothetical protein